MKFSQNKILVRFQILHFALLVAEQMLRDSWTPSPRWKNIYVSSLHHVPFCGFKWICGCGNCKWAAVAWLWQWKSITRIKRQKENKMGGSWPYTGLYGPSSRSAHRSGVSRICVLLLTVRAEYNNDLVLSIVPPDWQSQLWGGPSRILIWFTVARLGQLSIKF